MVKDLKSPLNLENFSLSNEPSDPDRYVMLLRACDLISSQVDRLKACYKQSRDGRAKVKIPPAETRHPGRPRAGELRNAVKNSR